MSLQTRDAFGNIQNLPNNGNAPAFFSVYTLPVAIAAALPVMTLNFNTATPSVAIRLKRVRLISTATGVLNPSPINPVVQVVKYSALTATAGGSVASPAPVIVPAASTNPASQAQVTGWSVGPTPQGTSVGVVAQKGSGSLGLPTSVAGTVLVDVDLTDGGTIQPPTLVAATEQIAITFPANCLAVVNGTLATSVLQLDWDEGLPTTATASNAV